jgi:2-methylcitrate dehydratase PrpD
LSESGITHRLARFLVESRWSDVPQPVRHEAKRATLNWLGCALGGCRDDAVARALATLDEFSGPRRATLIGRGEKLDALNTALINALSANILDYDDTHLKTLIHPTVPVAATALALAEHRPVTGAQFLHALILGVETACRIGNAVSPGHYAAGWHITATCGVFGAAAAAGKLLQLSEQQMTWALGIAATQSSGLTEMLGSMCKSYNMGHAAKSGLVAALLAAQNFTSSERAIEAPRGFANVLAKNAKLNEITDRLGATWELAFNAYKPFPCGIVLHPVIDGCIQLRDEHRINPGEIERIDVRLHPLALDLAGKKAPKVGLEGKLSVYHAAAVALIHGAAGVRQFSDACVRDPAVIALREKVVPQADARLEKIEGYVSITLRDGRRLDRHVAHAIGTLEHPMSDVAIETKFKDLAANVLPERQALDTIELVWSLDRNSDAASLARAAVPARAAYAASS